MTVTTPSAGARKTILSSRRSSTVTAAAAACIVVFGLVKGLLGFEALTCQRAGSCELGLHVVEAGACLGDCSLQRVDLLPADAGIDVVAVCGCRCERGTRL